MNDEETMTEDIDTFSAISKLTEREQLDFFSYVNKSMVELLSKHNIDESLDPYEKLYALMRLGVIPCPPIARPIVFSDVDDSRNRIYADNRYNPKNFRFKRDQKNSEMADRLHKRFNIPHSVFEEFMESEDSSEDSSVSESALTHAIENIKSWTSGYGVKININPINERTEWPMKKN